MRIEDPQLIASNPDYSCFVMASAGTGKTKMLVDRLLRLLLKGIPFSSILCLTFTKAGANEMHQRLFQKLEDILKLSPSHLIEYLKNLNILPTEEILEKTKNLFFDLLNQQQDLKIQTIHSFCQNLCETNSWSIGFTPPFILLEEIDQKDLILKSLNIISENIEFSNAFDIITSHISRNQFLELLHQAVLLDDDRIQKSIPPLDLERGIPLNSLENLLKDLPLNLLENMLNDTQSLKDIFLTKEGLARKKIFKKDILKQYNGLEELSNKIAEHLENLDDQRKLETLILLNTSFFSIVKATKDTYQKLKKERNALDFEDLIQFAKKILISGDFSFIEQQMGYKIKAILVDEAQDTSFSQWEIISTLVENMLIADQDNIASLLVVGDLKQAIYSFQGGKADFFLTKKLFFKSMFETYGKNFKELNLIKSFRCTKNVLNAVDRVFNKFPDGLFLEGDLKHIAQRSDDGFVSLIPLTNTSHNEDNEAWKPSHEREEIAKNTHICNDIVNFVDSLLKSNIMLDSTHKHVQPEDIMILVRNRTTFIENLTKLFYEKNIPCSGIDRFSLTEHPMIQDFLTLFEWVLSKSDDNLLAKLLKSPFFSEIGMNDHNLQKIILKNKNE